MLKGNTCRPIACTKGSTAGLLSRDNSRTKERIADLKSPRFMKQRLEVLRGIMFPTEMGSYKAVRSRNDLRKQYVTEEVFQESEDDNASKRFN